MFLQVDQYCFINPTPILILKSDTPIVTKENIKYFLNLEMRTAGDSPVDLSAKDGVLESPQLSNIKNIMDEAVNYYVTEVVGVSNKFKLVHSWLTKNVKGSHHHKHYHHNMMLTTLIYFNEEGTEDAFSPLVFTGEGVKRVFQKFQFEFNIIKENDINANSYTITPTTNHIIIFPGWIEHEVPPNTKEKTRYSIGGNYFINDFLGKENNYDSINIDVSGKKLNK
jgi:uncharacterized protein (TIGR02466 family)